MENEELLNSTEILELATADPVFFSHHFFPRTMRLPSGDMHRRVWDALESPARFVNIQMFRGAAKTSLLRVFTARRTSFSLSRTILYIGKSEGHATRSVDWLRRQIDGRNRAWAEFFQLTKGSKFQGVEAEIVNNLLDISTWIVGVGIEGSVRGLNIDDYRPDLIILDDVITEDNASSAEGRQTLNELIFGAVKESLAGIGEAPHAKMVLLATPIHKEDPSMQALTDPEWTSVRVSCWTPETEELPLEDRLSSWPAMFPSEHLREQKRYAIQRNQAHIFVREKEVKLVDSSTSSFRSSWLKSKTLLPERNELDDIVMSIDPVPKPSQREVEKKLAGKDYEVHQVWGRKNGEFILLEWARERGHNPSWSKTTFLRLARRWSPRLVALDATAYQATLAWILEEAMKEDGYYTRIEEVRDNRSKFDKIVDTLHGPGAQGRIFVPERYVEFRDQWNNYPDVAHDDDLDAGHLAIKYLAKMHVAAKAMLQDFPDNLNMALARKCP